jgi:hypothetical protein
VYCSVSQSVVYAHVRAVWCGDGAVLLVVVVAAVEVCGVGGVGVGGGGGGGVCGVGGVGLNYVYMLRIGVCECIVMTRSCIVFFMSYSSCS